MPPNAWRSANPDYHWRFPRDHWTHPGFKTEWWYFTGHLRSIRQPTRQFGYQFTLFRVGVLPAQPGAKNAWTGSDLIMGHAAITDLTSGKHWFAEVVNQAVAPVGGFGVPPDPVLAWTQAPAATNARWSLRWNGRGFDFAMRDDWQRIGFELTTAPRKSLVLQGPNGYSRKSSDPKAASLYYSFTRLATRGILRLGGDTLAVAGESWMDKEFGSNQLAADQVGWDWFSLTLDDGRDLMLYVLRKGSSGDSSETSWASGSVVARDGTVRWLNADQFTISRLASWQSPSTGANYPARWSIRIPGEGLSLEVVPETADQENRSSLVNALFYWEGKVAVVAPGAGGKRVGQGYAELTGYGDAARPAL